MPFFLTNPAFRTALNGIREQQGRLAEQNDILSAEIDDLESEVDRYVGVLSEYISFWTGSTFNNFIPECVPMLTQHCLPLLV